jgi:hypothetical protein
LAVAVAGGTLAGVGNLVEEAFGVSAFGLLFALGGLAWSSACGEQAGFALVGLTWIALAFLPGRRTRRFVRPEVVDAGPPRMRMAEGVSAPDRHEPSSLPPAIRQLRGPRLGR